MTLVQYAIVAAACGLAFSAIVIGATVIVWRKINRERRERLDRLHTIRHSFAGLRSAPGNQSRNSFKTERTKNDG